MSDQPARYTHRYPGLNVFDLFKPMRDVSSMLSMLASCQPGEHEIIDRIRAQIEDQLEVLMPLLTKKPDPEPFDIKRVKVTQLVETEHLDSDGTYMTYYLIEHEDYTATLDLKGLEEYANNAYQYRGSPGGYFCSRVTVWKHPYSGDKAIVTAEHALDI